MKVNIGDYKIETDSLQFVVKAKRIIEEGRLTKEENIGKETWQPVAYCTNFDSALKYLPQQVIMDNEDLCDVRQKLDEIRSDIKVIKEALEIKGGN